MRKGTVKSQKLKIKFHRTYWFVALGFILTGYYLNLIVFTSLILVHESGHYLMARLFHFRVDYVIIYPYGGFVKLNDLINRDIHEELLIASFGVIMQYAVYMVVVLFNHYGYIRDYVLNLYTLYNSQMIFFNLMPIYPLDGSKILNLFLSKFFSYNMANNVTIGLSAILISIVIGLNIFKCNYSNVMIMGVLFTYLYDFFRKRKYLYQRFLLERYLYQIDYPKVTMIKNLRGMYKNRSHLFWCRGGLMEEKEFLKRLFSRHTS